METIRGGRSGLHIELRKYVPDGSGVNFDDSKLLWSTRRPVFVERKGILRKLQNGHMPVPVAVAFSDEIAERKRYQLMRARALQGTSEMTPFWKRYYLKHLEEISALN